MALCWFLTWVFYVLLPSWGKLQTSEVTPIILTLNRARNMIFQDVAEKLRASGQAVCCSPESETYSSEHTLKKIPITLKQHFTTFLCLHLILYGYHTFNSLVWGISRGVWTYNCVCKYVYTHSLIENCWSYFAGTHCLAYWLTQALAHFISRAAKWKKKK